MATLSDRDFTKKSGAYIQPGVGTAYPDLVDMVRDIYRKRVSKLPFVPVGWLSDMETAMAGSTLVLLQQPLPYGKPTTNGMPDWILSDQAAMKAWQGVAELNRDTYSQYAMGKVEEGRKVVARANANAAFWDTLYTTAVAIRDAPGNAVNAVGRGALDFLKSFLSKTWWILALAAAGWLVWNSRSAIGEAASKRFRKAIQ